MVYDLVRGGELVLVQWSSGLLLEPPMSYARLVS